MKPDAQKKHNVAVLHALCELSEARTFEGASAMVVARRANVSLRDASKALAFLQRSDLVDPVNKGYVPSEHGINSYRASLAQDSK